MKFAGTIRHIVLSEMGHFFKINMRYREPLLKLTSRVAKIALEIRFDGIFC